MPPRGLTSFPRFSLSLLYVLFGQIVSMFYSFFPLLLAALGLPLSVTGKLCNSQNLPVNALAWYEGWASAPSSISYNKYSALTFAFATPSNDVSQIVLDSVSQAALPPFVQEAHNNGVKVILSCGGFDGSRYFSIAVTPENRTTFVNAVTALVHQTGVDGIEIDWEFPGSQPSGGCNTVSSADSANYLAFLQDLRQALGPSKTIAAAVGLNTWLGPDKTPLTDVSAYAQVLDYISVMGYDVFGAWSSTAGPNAPVNDTCAPSVDQEGCAVSAISNWVNAGFPKNKINLGVPAYGHSFSVSRGDALTSTGALQLYPVANTAQQPLGPDDPPAGSPPTYDNCGNIVKPGGVYNFNSLIAQGYLSNNGTYSTGIDFTFDSCSETPYIYNSSSEVMISYDDQRSFNVKGNYITANGLAGFAMWPLAGDSDDMLIDAISAGVGIQQCT